ncbi:hypothetical protein FHS96_004426 [Sphingomonas zeicaulis]|uniref:sulfotransferase family protein n=1 Tax=Sphingomonas zeicaulis TaxID=1632740 RepID=UPI003D24EE69
MTEAQPGPVRASRRIAAVNRLLETLWAQGLATDPPLDPDALEAAARKAAGPAFAHQPWEARFDDGWRRRLTLLSEELVGTARLTALGRTIAHGQIVAALATRLRAEALWRRHPEILEAPLPAPIIIVGQMRSGSTRMQRLLACDPRLDFTRFYESWNPVPRRPGGRPDDRRLRTFAGLSCARLLNPGFAAIHPTGIAQPDEEIGFYSPSIFGSAFEAQWRVPFFARHCETTDRQPVYASFRRMVQTIRWLRRGVRRDDRPWILKTPQFSQDLAAVAAAFPDARLILLRRDESATIASAVSLVGNQVALQSSVVDRGWITAEWTRKVRLREERMAADTVACRLPQVMVDFTAMEADWETQMARIYPLLGLGFDAEVRGRMKRYVRSVPHRRLERQRNAALAAATAG